MMILHKNVCFCISLLSATAFSFVPSPLVTSGVRSGLCRAASSRLRVGSDVLDQEIKRNTGVQTADVTGSSVTVTSKTKTPMGDLTKQLVTEDTSTKAADEYSRGFLIIGFITFLNASTNPAWHAAFGGEGAISPLLLNAMVSVVALIGLVAGGPLLESSTPTMSTLAQKSESKTDEIDATATFTNLRGGAELGFWKFLGTTSHLLGLSLTTANHGAFLIQLTTLIVPVIEGLQGEMIPRRIKLAVLLALGGIVAFTQDPSGAAATPEMASQQALGDALCVACAFFYSFYDIQTFKWGKVIPRTQLVTTKVATQAFLSCILLATTQWTETTEFFSTNAVNMGTLVPVVLWSGLIVNALATFLQVGGMQAVGPTRAQTIFASQPLWSAGLSYAFLGETIGLQGAVGGSFFLFALFLAATDAKKASDAKATS